MKTILDTPWVPRRGQVVPKTDDVALKDGAVRLQATYLYADMRDSTLLAERYRPEFAARVIRMFLQGTVAMIREQNGHIRSFDGDRVMGVFIGGSRRNNAVAAGLRITWIVDQAINPLLRKRAASNGSAEWQVAHCSGIDDGESFIVRGGARDNSDLVSVGEAPNIAAKLSAVKDAGSMIATSRVYDVLKPHNLYSGDGDDMWDGPDVRIVGPHRLGTYSCDWMRSP